MVPEGMLGPSETSVIEEYERGPNEWMSAKQKRVKAPRREYDHRYNLFARQMEPCDDFGFRWSRPHLQIVKDKGKRRPRIKKDPGTTTPPVYALQCGTL